jgi:hypothetical protein
VTRQPESELTPDEVLNLPPGELTDTLNHAFTRAASTAA